jgi:hypothetical protein
MLINNRPTKRGLNLREQEMVRYTERPHFWYRRNRHAVFKLHKLETNKFANLSKKETMNAENSFRFRLPMLSAYRKFKILYLHVSRNNYEIKF